jgi:hypothetical protein
MSRASGRNILPAEACSTDRRSRTSNGVTRLDSSVFICCEGDGAAMCHAPDESGPVLAGAY